MIIIVRTMQIPWTEILTPRRPQRYGVVNEEGEEGVQRKTTITTMAMGNRTDVEW